MKKPPSLIRRLWLASVLVLPILVGFSALALNRAFVSSIDQAEYDALLAQVYALLAVAEPINNHLSLPSALPNPRFETPESGLYARVIDQNNQVIWQSNSLTATSIELPISSMTDAGTAQEVIYPLASGDYRSLSFTTIWDINNHDQEFTFNVIHDQASKNGEITAYNKSLFSWLGAMAALLIAIQIGIARWGLKPLKQLAVDISQIQSGKAEKLDHIYPIEIQPVTDSVNILLNSESAQRERYKNSLADLAHSLKTPLSVIRAQLLETQKDQLVDEQIERMTAIISHQLKRANAQVQTAYGQRTPVRPTVERICNALAKIYRDKGTCFTLNINDGIHCDIDQDDLMEIMGNLIENACKYGRSEVSIHASTDSEEVIICVEDDGPGVDLNAKSKILNRGARADSAQLGQGIGLSVAVDILSSYNGALSIDRSAAGGASFKIILPRAGSST